MTCAVRSGVCSSLRLLLGRPAAFERAQVSHKLGLSHTQYLGDSSTDLAAGLHNLGEAGSPSGSL